MFYSGAGILEYWLIYCGTSRLASSFGSGINGRFVISNGTTPAQVGKQ
jgi:hypothetical protein